MIDHIHDLLDQLWDAVSEAYPEATNAMLNLHSNGYRNIVVEKTKVDDNLPCAAWKRRELLDQYRHNGEWSKDRSQEQNRYYKENKILLEEEEG